MDFLSEKNSAQEAANAVQTMNYLEVKISKFVLLNFTSAQSVALFMGCRNTFGDKTVFSDDISFDSN